MKVLVLGAGGMLGHVMLRLFRNHPGVEAVGTIRSARVPDSLPDDLRDAVVTGVDLSDGDRLVDVMARTRPGLVINCAGVVKQRETSDDPLEALPINALLPHRLSKLCAVGGARLVHFSTDCVFDGSKGGYAESDPPTPVDLYGRSKLVGEVDAPHAITLRTSLIGPELTVHRGLLDWFLAQTSPINGYRRAIFSGFTTLEAATVVRDYVLPRPELHGVYHAGGEPISKFDLLTLIGQVYGHDVGIRPDETFALDRSLDSSRFRAETGYVPPPWPRMIAEMRRVHP